MGYITPRMENKMEKQRETERQPKVSGFGKTYWGLAKHAKDHVLCGLYRDSIPLFPTNHPKM